MINNNGVGAGPHVDASKPMNLPNDLDRCAQIPKVALVSEQVGPDS